MTTRRCATWDVGNGNTVRQMGGHTNFINSLSVSRDGKRQYTGSLDISVRVWNIDKGEEIAKFMLQHEVWSVTISPDGKRVVAATVGNVCKLFDVDGMKELLTLQVPSRVWSVAFAVPTANRSPLAPADLLTLFPPCPSRAAGRKKAAWTMASTSLKSTRANLSGDWVAIP